MKKVLCWIVVIGLLFVAGCQTVKGIAGDIGWTANKIDQAIVVPE